MRYSEFNKKLYEFELQHHLSDIHIFCDGNLVGKVSKKCRYSLSTIYEVFEDLPEKVAFMLYENMVMLAETPLTEREEEKRYRLRYVTPPLLRRKLTAPEYLYIRRCDGYIDTSLSAEDDPAFQTIFTESEIAEMDITGFVKEEVY